MSTPGRAMWAAVLAAASVLVPPAVAPAHGAAPGCAAGTSPADLSELFGSGSAGLIGGDYPHAYPLPDGRTLWMFQDSFIGDPSSPTLDSASFVHNAAMVQTGLCFQVRSSGPVDAPRSFLGGDLEVPLSHWFWPLGGAMGADGQLNVFAAEMVNPAGTGAAVPAAPVAVWRATIRVSDLAVTSFAPAADALDRPLYGFSVVEDDSWSYLYGNCYRQFTDPAWLGAFDLSCTLDNRVARVPKGHFDAAPTYWNGSAWGADRNAAVVVSRDGVLTNPMQVTRIADGRFVAVSRLDDWFGTTARLSVATAASGPFVPYADVDVPRKCPADTCTTYFASFLPWRSNGAFELAVSHFTWSFDVSNAIPGLYRPSVISAPVPPPVPNGDHYDIAADGTLELQAAGRLGVGPDATVVAVTVTATDAEGPGFVTVWPCGVTRPLSSNLNLVVGQAVANMVLVAVGAGGRVCLWSSAATELVVDVQGWEGAAPSFHPVVPARLMDTRPGAATVDGHFAGSGPLRGGSPTVMQVTARGGVPTSARVIVLNVTAVDAAGGGYVTVWPCGAQPVASNLNTSSGQTVPNLVVVALSSAGTVCLRSSLTVHVVIDVQGWYGAVADVHPAGPARLFDSRPAAFTVDGQGRLGRRIAVGEVVPITVQGRVGIGPSEAAVLNVVVIDPTGSGFLRAWPCGEPEPATSNVNFVTGRTRAALAITRVGADGTVCIALGGTGTADVVVDVTAWYPVAAGGYEPLVPVRSLDTRG